MDDYERLRNDLVNVADEFASCRTLPLNHDLIWAPDGDDWDEREYAAFCAAYRGLDHAEWESWELWPNRRACSRFWTHTNAGESYVWEFKRKAETACTILDMLQKWSNGSAGFPDGFRLWLEWLSVMPSSDISHHPWLEIIHAWAIRFQTVRLRGECCWWNYAGPPLTGSELEILMDQTVTPPEGGTPYRTHPLCNKLYCNVFVASEEFIRICTEPDMAILLDEPDGDMEIRLPEPADIPYWDAYKGELWFKDDLIKRFTKPAAAQRRLLDVFEENGWVHEIRNPFRMDIGNLDEANEACRNAVEGLNDDHLTEDRLKFGTRSQKDFVYWTDLTTGE